MSDFKPSQASLTPRRQVLQTLKYARSAVSELEKQVKASDDDAIPSWALTRINQGATCLGQALSLLAQLKQRGET